MNLPSGQFFGASLRQYTVDGLTLTLSGYQSGQRQPWHTHEHPTLFFPLQHALRDSDERDDYLLEPLTPVYHPLDAKHRSETGREKVTGINLEFSFSWLARHHLTPDDLGAYCLLSAPAARLTALRLAQELAGASEPDAAILEAHALELLTHLTARAVHGGRSPSWLPLVEAYLRDSAPSSVSLRDAAREAGVHPVYLARAFRAHLGCSVGDYLRRLRLLRAAVHTLQTGATLTESAHAAGFADHAHLTRQFVRETGKRPSGLTRLRGFGNQVSIVQDAPASRPHTGG